jgi:transcription initiation factor TFIIIB Brf1 subunit/transcription initiation factor TFIIB
VTSVRPDDLEALESVSQNVEARDLFLRMAHLSGAGELNRFLSELSLSDEIDAETKAVFTEVAQDRAFLSALDDYVHLTRLLH